MGENSPILYRGGAVGSVVSTSGAAHEGGDGEEAPPATNTLSPGFRALVRFISLFSLSSCVYHQGKVSRPLPFSEPLNNSLFLIKPYYTTI